jgi:hypothetical protein
MLAISSGRMRDCKVWPVITWRSNSGVSQRRICRSVQTAPGEMVFTRMPLGPNSVAIARVSPWTAALHALSGAFHLRTDGLYCKKNVPQVDGHPFIPIFRRHRLERVTIVVGGVVDEHSDVTELRAGLLDGGAKGFDIADVTFQK